MNTFSLIQLVGAVGSERFIIQSIVLQYGINSLIENIDSIEISNKTKNAVKQLDGILHNVDNNIVNFSSLTEISMKELKQYQQQGKTVMDMMKHPEKINVDFRQFEKIRYLKDVIEGYLQEQEQSREVGHDLEL